MTRDRVRRGALQRGALQRRALQRGAAGALAALLVLTGCHGGGGHLPAGRTALGVDAELRALLPDDVRQAGRLVVATDPSYPPASAFAADGRTIVGFEPDLGAAMGELLGVEVEFRAEPFDTVLDGLADGAFDAVMSAMTDTPERETRADFVNYFEAGSSIVVQQGNPLEVRGLTDLCGQVVALERGTVHVDLVARAQPPCGAEPIEVRALPTNDDALLELRTGRAAAVLADYPPAVYVTTDPRTRDAFALVPGAQYEPGLYGIAVSRERRNLTLALSRALQRLVENGVYAQVLADWEVTSGAIAAVTVNRGHR